MASVLTEEVGFLGVGGGVWILVFGFNFGDASGSKPIDEFFDNTGDETAALLGLL